MSLKKCIFFDRDGVVNKRLVGDYVKKISEFEFKSDFLEFFNRLSDNYLKIIITNQQGIGKGLMTENDLANIHSHMQRHLSENFGKNFDDIYFCPDLKELNSFRRKPNPGMILEAMDKWKIEASRSWMIGDSESDIVAGSKAGLKTIFISDKQYSNQENKPNYQFTDLSQIDLEIFK